MTDYTTESFTVIDLITEMNVHIEKIDALIANARGGEYKYILKEVREGVRLSRLKLIYQLNNQKDFAADIRIYEDGPIERLMKEIERKNALLKKNKESK